MTSGLPDRVARWLPTTQALASMYEVDPLDVLAILDREGLGGDALQPRGPGGTGDHGHGHGLGQIDDRYHPTFIAAVGPDGVPLWKKAHWNIHYVCDLLSWNVHHFDGTGADPRICGIASFNASWKRVREVLSRLTQPLSEETLIFTLDPLTTPSKVGGKGDYVSDVLARRRSYVLSP